MLKPLRPDGEGLPSDIKLDVVEGDNAYTVKAEVPGFAKEDLKVRIEGSTVSISAKTKRENEVKEGGRVIRSERYAGSLFRSFSLGHEINDKEARARVVDGVLELTLPKRAVSATSTLRIE